MVSSTESMASDAGFQHAAAPRIVDHIATLSGTPPVRDARQRRPSASALANILVLEQ